MTCAHREALFSPKSFSLIFLRTLLSIFAFTKNSTLLFSSDSALFAKNTRGGVPPTPSATALASITRNCTQIIGNQLGVTARRRSFRYLLITELQIADVGRPEPKKIIERAANSSISFWSPLSRPIHAA